MKTSHRVFLVAAALSLGLSGCASYSVEPFHPGAAWPPGRGAGGRVIGVRVHGETFLNDKEEGTSLKDWRIWQDRTLRAYRESGLFAKVEAASMDVDPKTGAFVDPEAGIEGTDLRADVRIVDRQRVNWTMAIITGVTAYIIPSKVTSDLTVKTTIRDNKGQVLGEFTTSNTTDLWQQLFLLTVMPFHYPPSVERQRIFDLNRATLMQVDNKGILVPKAAAPKKKP